MSYRRDHRDILIRTTVTLLGASLIALCIVLLVVGLTGDSKQNLSTPGYQSGNAEEVTRTQAEEQPNGLEPTEYGTPVSAPCGSPQSGVCKGTSDPDHNTPYANEAPADNDVATPPGSVLCDSQHELSKRQRKVLWRLVNQFNSESEVVLSWDMSDRPGEDRLVIGPDCVFTFDTGAPSPVVQLDEVFRECVATFVKVDDVGQKIPGSEVHKTYWNCPKSWDEPSGNPVINKP